MGLEGSWGCSPGKLEGAPDQGVSADIQPPMRAILQTRLELKVTLIWPESYYLDSSCKATYRMTNTKKSSLPT